MSFALCFGGAASAQGYAKGVNPADNLTRADAALDWMDVDDDSFTGLTLGYEHRLHENWGIGAFLTPLAEFDGDTGTGDVGVRARYIGTFGDWRLGVAVDLAGSTGEPSVLGKNRLRVVPSVLVVRPWSPEDFTAFEAAWVEWFDNHNGYAVIRAEQGHLFAGGWFLVGDVSYKVSRSDVGLSLEVGKQLGESWQVALRPGYAFRDSGDPSVQLRTAYFF